MVFIQHQIYSIARALWRDKKL